VWFNSSVAFNSHLLNYVLERGNSTASTDRRDSIGVGGSYPTTTPGVLFGVAQGTTVYNGSTVLAPNTWNYALLVRDDSLSTGQFKIYLNGNLTPEVTANLTFGTGTGEYFAAGNRTDGNTDLGINGRFDEVAVWNYALSAQQAQLVYQSAFVQPAPEPSSVALLGVGALVCLRRRRAARA
jgi:hypothetical protein